MLVELFTGRTVVGYHVEMKLAELDILESTATFIDASKMFNASPTG